MFKLEIKKVDDPLLDSILTQLNFKNLDKINLVINLELSEKYKFFSEIWQDKQLIWQPVIAKIFGQAFKINLELIKVNNLNSPNANNISNSSAKASVSDSSNNSNKNFSYKIQKRPSNKTIDVSDESKWPIAKLLLSSFPGTISEID